MPHNHAEYMRDWRRKYPEKHRISQRKSRYKRKYGLSEADYFELLASQDFKCAICPNGPEKERYGRLNVDHCHASGAVRGLLCTSCNHAIGKLGDSAESIARVLAYLRKTSS